VPESACAGTLDLVRVCPGAQLFRARRVRECDFGRWPVPVLGLVLKAPCVLSAWREVLLVWAVLAAVRTNDLGSQARMDVQVEATAAGECWPGF
jgi:hypothetical protein